jgi:hypothetical protein
VKSLEAKVTLEYGDEKTARSIAQAISPDNFKTPPGLDIKTFQEKSTVITCIKSERKLATFTATIDDLLFSASIAEKTLLAIKKIR